jgi:hypothetical protein
MTEKDIQSEDYISSAGIKRFIIGLFRAFFRGIALIQTIFKEYYLLLIVGVLVGGLVGLLYHILAGKNYKVSMMVQTNALDKKSYMSVLDQLNFLAASGSQDKIATALDISPLLAENVTKIGGENLLGQPLDIDTTGSGIFRIVIGTKSPYGIDSLGISIINYINRLPYLKRQTEEMVRIWNAQLVFIDGELTRIDSLKRDYTRSLTTTKLVSGYYNNVFDPVSIYKESFSLDSTKGEINRHLIHGAEALSILTNFKATDKPQSLSRTMSIAAWCVSGFLLAFIFGILLEIKKKVNG